MRVCLSQFRSSESLDQNVERHLAVLERAAAQHCDLVLFPELSLSGYATQRAVSMAMTLDAPAVHRLHRACEALGLVAACGAPLATDTGGTEIGMLVFQPGHPPARYAKRWLHPDEMAAFVPGKRTLDIVRGEHRVSPAICYESLLAPHAREALDRGATVYAASVAKHAEGIERAHQHYAALAREHGIWVLVANAVGPCDDFVAAGQTAAWSPDGSRVVHCGSNDEAEPVVQVS